MKLTYCSVLIFLAIFSIAECKSWTERTVERPVLVGAFNIQNLGQSKMGNKTVMDIVKKILLRYDLIVIQEIVTPNEELIHKVVKDLNGLHKEKNSNYKIKLSERLGRGTAKEQYAFLYRDDKFKLLAAETFPDKKDDFMRPPYIGHFATPTLRDMQSMVVIGVHTQPKNAGNETSSLAKVYDYAVKRFKVKDAIIMGDFNAGCQNVRISEWKKIELWTRPEFQWLISHDSDTTLSVNCCPYDRIVVAGDGMQDAIILNSVNIFKYLDVYGITADVGLAVSDHWPVEVKLRGGTSEPAESNISPSICLTIQDSRSKSLPLAIRSQKTTFGFTITSTNTSTELHAKSSDDIDILRNLQTLQSKYPQLISDEVTDIILYKIEHGALKDITSNNEVERPSFSVLVHFNERETKTTVHYCAVTTLN